MFCVWNKKLIYYFIFDKNVKNIILILKHFFISIDNSLGFDIEKKNKNEYIKK